jgi:hypothetical protein
MRLPYGSTVAGRSPAGRSWAARRRQAPPEPPTPAPRVVPVARRSLVGRWRVAHSHAPALRQLAGRGAARARPSSRCRRTACPAGLPDTTPWLHGSQPETLKRRRSVTAPSPRRPRALPEALALIGRAGVEPLRRRAARARTGRRRGQSEPVAVPTALGGAPGGPPRGAAMGCRLPADPSSTGGMVPAVQEGPGRRAACHTSALLDLLSPAPSIGAPIATLSPADYMAVSCRLQRPAAAARSANKTDTGAPTQPSPLGFHSVPTRFRLGLRFARRVWPAASGCQAATRRATGNAPPAVLVALARLLSRRRR